MTAEKKLAQKTLMLLQLAERLRNVSEACQRRGISWSQPYEYKRAFQERGLDRLLERLPFLRYRSGECKLSFGTRVYLS
jgi:hypothetical protein